MYIPPFAVGFILGAVVGATVLIIIALVAADKNDDGKEEK